MIIDEKYINSYVYIIYDYRLGDIYVGSICERIRCNIFNKRFELVYFYNFRCGDSEELRNREIYCQKQHLKLNNAHNFNHPVKRDFDNKILYSIINGEFETYDPISKTQYLDFVSKSDNMYNYFGKKYKGIYQSFEDVFLEEYNEVKQDDTISEISEVTDNFFEKEKQFVEIPSSDEDIEEQFVEIPSSSDEEIEETQETEDITESINEKYPLLTRLKSTEPDKTEDLDTIEEPDKTEEITIEKEQSPTSSNEEIKKYIFKLVSGINTNNEPKTPQIYCECGSKYTKKHKYNHLKTKKHLKFIESKSLIQIQ